jgi:hypothetical protein
MASNHGSSPLCLSADERDRLYAEIEEVFESGRLEIVEAQLLDRDWESARVTGIECSDLLRLVTDDLGWGPRSSREPIYLETDQEVLGRCSEHLPAYRDIFTSDNRRSGARLPPYVRHRITAEQRKSLFDLAITRLSRSGDISIFIQTENLADLPALAAEFSDLLHFMVEALVPRQAEGGDGVEIAIPADILARAARILKSFSASTETAVEVQLLDDMIPLIKSLDRARLAREACETMIAASREEAA